MRITPKNWNIINNIWTLFFLLIDNLTHAYNVFWSSPPPYSLFFLLKSFPNPTNFSLPTPSALPHWVHSSNLSHTSHNFFQQTIQHLPLSSLNSACMGTSIEPFTGIWVPSFSSEVTYLKRTNSPLSKHQVPIAPQLGVGLPDFLHSPWWDFVWLNLLIDVLLPFTTFNPSVGLN